MTHCLRRQRLRHRRRRDLRRPGLTSPRRLRADIAFASKHQLRLATDRADRARVRRGLSSRRPAEASQTPPQPHSLQTFGVHSTRITAEAEEQEDHERAAEPDVARVHDRASGRDLVDVLPGHGVVDHSPAERDVAGADLLADDIGLQGD